MLPTNCAGAAMSVRRPGLADQWQRGVSPESREGHRRDAGPVRDGVKYTVKNSSKTGDDGWKEMLAPAG